MRGPGAQANPPRLGALGRVRAGVSTRALTRRWPRARSLDNSELAFRSEDYAPSRWGFQREAAALLATGARLHGAAPAAGAPRAERRGAAAVAVVLAGGAPRVLVPPQAGVDAALAAVSLVQAAEGPGGLLGGLRLAAVRPRRTPR
jgi:hypothetical protein